MFQWQWHANRTLNSSKLESHYENEKTEMNKINKIKVKINNV